MKEFFKLTTFLFIFVLSNKLAIAATATGNADVYKVIMRKVELCTGYTVVDFDDVGTAAACHDAVTIGSGDKEVDIASVSAGGGFSVAVSRTGAVFSWGKWANGRLGNSSHRAPVVPV